MTPIIKAEIVRKHHYFSGLIAGKSVKKIAKEQNVHVSSVYYFIKKIGFKMKTFKRASNNPHKVFVKTL